MKMLILMIHESMYMMCVSRRVKPTMLVMMIIAMVYVICVDSRNTMMMLIVITDFGQDDDD